MQLLLIFTSITVFVLMLKIGTNRSPAQLISLWRHPERVAVSLLAVLVVVPAVFLVVIGLFPLPAEAAVALALLAAAPGAPLTTKRSEIAAADPEYVSSLQLSLAVLAVAAMPLILGAFHLAFDLSITRVEILVVARQIAEVTLLPVVIGLAIQHLAPNLAARIAQPIAKLAHILFLLLIAAILLALFVVPELQGALAVGWPTVAAVTIAAAAAIAIGHTMGGPLPGHRAGLATACVARNVGLTLYVAGLANYAEQTLPVILVYMLIGAALAIPYGLWSRRQAAPAS
jgi:BASS family bile acid:Na+ symporter